MSKDTIVANAVKMTAKRSKHQLTTPKVNGHTIAMKVQDILSVVSMQREAAGNY
uniref:Uncharacterized protein n=1 Tax=Arion vulgaris TaxID=1028688 RepID=A0A0B7B886_9EUPU